MMGKKLFTIIVTSLLCLPVFAYDFMYLGVDGDGEQCRFSYDSNKTLGRLELNQFSFLPIEMKFHKKFRDLYFNVFAGAVKHSSYSIIAEGVDLNDPKLVLQTLNLITVVEEHDGHAHVWFCMQLEQDKRSVKGINF